MNCICGEISGNNPFCQVHHPRPAALAGETRTEAEKSEIAKVVYEGLYDLPFEELGARSAEKALFMTVGERVCLILGEKLLTAASRIAQLEREQTEAETENDKFRQLLREGKFPNWKTRAETAEAALTQAQQERDEWKDLAESNQRSAEALLTQRDEAVDERDEARKDKRTIGGYFGYGDISETLTAKQLAEFLDKKNRESFDSVTTHMKELHKKELTTLRAQKSALMEALEPFAKSEFGHGYAEHKAAARVYEQAKEKI